MVNKNSASIGNLRKKSHEIHGFISASYHEAGHVVYGLLHFIKIECTTVFEDKKFKTIEGITYHHCPDLAPLTDAGLLNDLLHIEIGFNYSGLLAEKRYFNLASGSRNFPMFLKSGSSADINRAARLFKKYNLIEPGRKRYEYKQKFIKKVDRELQNNWDDVVIVSHALFQKKKLSFEDLKLLLTKKSKNKIFWKNQFKLIDLCYQDDSDVDINKLQYILSF